MRVGVGVGVFLFMVWLLIDGGRDWMDLFAGFY